ncbi:MAG: hypothetical protein ACOYK9_06455 [Chlamydiia bacterium]
MNLLNFFQNSVFLKKLRLLDLRNKPFTKQILNAESNFKRGLLSLFFSFLPLGLSGTTSYIYTCLENQIDVVNSSTGERVQSIPLNTPSAAFGGVNFSVDGTKGLYIDTNINRCSLFHPKENVFYKEITFPSLAELLNGIILNDGTVYICGNDSSDRFFVFKFDSQNSEIKQIFFGGAFYETLVELLINPQQTLSTFNMGKNSSLLDLKSDGYSNIFSNNRPYPGWVGTFSQDGKKWIYISEQEDGAPTPIPIVSIVDPLTREVLENTPIPFPPGFVPVLNRIGANYDGSILVAISSNNSSVTPENVLLISLTGAFDPKTVSTTTINSRNYGSYGSVCVNPKGTEAFLFGGSNLYTITIPSGDLNPIPNYLAPTPIQSIGILTTSLTGVSQKIESTWQNHYFSTLNWEDIFDPTFFEIYRNGEKIATLPGTNRSYEDHDNLSSSTSYTYTVVSISSSGLTSEVGAITLTTS